MNTGFQLFQLQEIDTAIDKANRKIKEIEANLLDDLQVKQAKARVEICEAKYLHQKTLFDSLHEDQQTKKIKKTQSESSLYGGSIVNPKELQDLQKEIASLTSFISTCEDKLLNILVDLEKEENELTEAKAKLQKTLSEFESKKSLLNGEKNQLLHNIDNQLGKRESVAVQFEQSIMDIYDSLRKTKNGVAVARLQDNSCSSCGSSLTASNCQQIKSQTKLFYCPNCGRILYGS
jgi:predicted  nucleic acid-binding Zn-ribbon protein